MIAKLNNFSEITKLPSVKSRIGDDIFSLFSKFRLSQTLSRLCMEKQCGYSASELIQALCLFKVLGETISSMWYHKFYDLLQVGKNCFYRMLTRSSMDWRRLLAVMAVHFIGILRSRKVDFYKGTSCFILDDTTAEKTTKRGERGRTGIAVRIFLVKYGHNTTWNIIVTTDMTMSFTRAFETYQVRWGIEVLIKDCRRNWDSANASQMTSMRRWQT